MRRSELPLPLAALLCGALTAAAAAQGIAPDFLSAEPNSSAIVGANTVNQEQTGLPPKSLAAATQNPRAGNPLWAIPVNELSETRARPLFSDSRRPRAPPVIATLPPPPAKPAPLPNAEPDHPLLTLVGTIAGHSVEIGVFIDETSHDVVRLKSGEAHGGWTLRSVSGGTATFQKPGYLAAMLVFPARGAEANTPSVIAEPVVSGRSRQITGVPPANPPTPYPIPGSTKGGLKRPAREG